MKKVEKCLTGMRSDVSLELRQFYRGVITFGAFVGFLEGVAISDVSDELPGCRETRIAFLTSVRLRSRMCIDVVLLDEQGRKGGDESKEYGSHCRRSCLREGD